jgi:hypothetical protein
MNLMLKFNYDENAAVIFKQMTEVQDVIDTFSIYINRLDDIDTIISNLSHKIYQKTQFFIQYGCLDSTKKSLDDKKSIVVEFDLSTNIVENISLGKKLTQDAVDCAYRCTTIAQAIIASKSGARYVIVDLNQMQDIQYAMVEDICEIYKNYPDLYGEIIVETILDDFHCIKFGRCGVDILSMNNFPFVKL